MEDPGVTGEKGWSGSQRTGWSHGTKSLCDLGKSLPLLGLPFSNVRWGPGRGVATQVLMVLSSLPPGSSSVFFSSGLGRRLGLVEGWSSVGSVGPFRPKVSQSQVTWDQMGLTQLELMSWNFAHRKRHCCPLVVTGQNELWLQDAAKFTFDGTESLLCTRTQWWVRHAPLQQIHASRAQIRGLYGFIHSL